MSLGRLPSLLSVLALAACSSRGPAADDVLCTVNGVPIREMDVEYRLRTSSHGGALTPEFRKNLLESIVREQLVSGRAIALGLDADPGYRETVRQLDAHAAAVKRKRLAEIYARREGESRIEVSEAEARRYFDDNKDRLRTELHVLQILRRSEAEIRRVEDSLGQGAPWVDLGYLKWQEVPEPWRASVEKLQNGQVSKVLHGGKDRYWIIKLVDRRQGAEVGFDAVKAALIDQLRATRAERRRDELESSLRRQATIVYTPAK